MSRLLKMLEEFDDNVTVGQAISKLKQDEISAKQKETEEIDKVKEDFSNTYLKELDEHSLFGRTLNIYHLKDYVRSERTTDWSLIYYFEGSKISFSKGDIHRGDFCSNSFSEEDLRDMTKITKEEFEEYYVKNYCEIEDKLNNIVG